MASAEQIAAVILETAGKPSSGWIAENAKLLADKIVRLDDDACDSAVKGTNEATREKRVTEVEEIR